MNTIDKSLTSNILSQKEIRRYAIQISSSSIGLTGQEKLKQAKILVIGAGGKGTVILQHLAAMGIGTLGISDNLLVEEAELTRQFLYGNSDLGKQKAIISKQKLIEINHMVNYQLHNVCLNADNINWICEEYDILIDATDNFPARYLINDAAIKLNKPMIFGLAEGVTGMISVFNYKNGPSLRCLFPKVPTGINNNVPGESIAEVSILSIIGAIIANETVKVILGKDTQLSGNLLKFNGSDYSFIFETIQKNPDNFKN